MGIIHTTYTYYFVTIAYYMFDLHGHKIQMRSQEKQ